MLLCLKLLHKLLLTNRLDTEIDTEILISGKHLCLLLVHASKEALYTIACSLINCHKYVRGVVIKGQVSG